MLVLTRVLVRDENGLKDVLAKRSMGVPGDCWILVDPSHYDDEMRMRLKAMYDELLESKEREVHTTCILDGSLTFFRIWHIDFEVLTVFSEKCTLSEEPIEVN